MHTLLSLYFVPVVPLCPPGSGLLAFFMLREHVPFQSGNGFGSWISMDARDLADSHSCFFVAQMPVTALRIKDHCADRRNDPLPKRSRAEFGVPAVLWSEERAQ